MNILKKIKASDKQILIILLVLVVFGVFMSNFWHSISPNNHPFSDAKLTYFDTNTTSLQPVCFGLKITPHFMEGISLETIKVETNKYIVFEHEISLSNKKEKSFSFQKAINRSNFSESQFEGDSQSLDICILPKFLKIGTNKIDIYAGKNHLFFHTTQTASEKLDTNTTINQQTFQKLKTPSISFLGQKNDTISFMIKNDSTGGTYPIEIIHESLSFKKNNIEPSLTKTVISNYLIDFLPNEKKIIKLPISDFKKNINQAHIPENSEFIRAIFKGTYQEFKLQETKQSNPNTLLGILLLTITLIASFVFFRKKNKIEQTSNALTLFILVFMIVPWVLNFLKIPLNQLSISVGISLLFITIFILKKYFFKEKPTTITEDTEENKTKKNTSFLIALIPLAGIILFSLIFFFIPSHFNNWNVFYERYAETINANNTIPINDTLSYLGRGFTFVWGYFLFNSSIHFVTGAQANALFYFMWLFTNTLFAYSAINFAKTIKLNEKQQLLFYALFMTSLFIFVTWSVSPKHVLAFSLAIVAATRMIKRKNTAITAIIGAMAAFTQFSMIVFVPAIYLIFSKKIDFKKIILTIIAMFSLFVLLYIPIFVSWGLPYEVEPQKWGYMINHSFFDLFPDLGELVFFFLTAGFLIAIKKWKQIDSYAKKLVVSGTILLFIQLFVSYRVNLLTHMTLIVLALQIFSKKLKEKNFLNIIIVVIAISLFINFSILSNSTTPFEYSSGITYLKNHSLSSENTAVSPLHSHVVTYLGQRKTLSDLYVEYADVQKLSDNYSLILDEDKEIMQKYNIKYIIIDPKKVFLDATKPTFFSKEKEFDFMDKVYSNQKITIHRQSKIKIN